MGVVIMRVGVKQLKTAHGQLLNSFNSRLYLHLSQLKENSQLMRNYNIET